MRVAFINSVLGFGSTGKIVELLASSHELDELVFFGRKKYEGYVCNYKFNDVFGITNHAIQTFIYDNHGFVNKNQTMNLVKQLKAFKPDLVHLHNLHGYYLNIEVLINALKELDVPVVYTLHDCWSFTGHCAHYDSIGCEQWKTLCKYCPQTLQYPWTFNKCNVSKNYLKKKQLFNNWNKLALVTPSLWLKKQIESSFLAQYPCYVINNGIDLNVFKPTNRKLNNKVKLLAVSSIWYKQKGLYDLVDFSKLLDDKYELTVVGLNKKQCKLFPSSVNTVTRTSNVQELVDLYGNADCFLNFTYSDTFPTVNLESLACGTPIITYDVGGSPEVIADGTGTIMKKGDYKQCYNLLENQILKQFDRIKCVEASKQYSLDNMATNYLNLYKELQK